MGVADKEDFDQTFIAPLAAPGVPARLYFLFQQPIVLRPEEAGDKARCEEVYSQVGRRLGGGGEVKGHAWMGTFVQARVRGIH